MDLSVSGEDPVAVSCEHGDVPSGATEVAKILSS